MDSTLLLSEPLTVEQCLSWVTDADLRASEAFSASRRAEYLSWRAVLSRHLGRVVQVEYDALGAPRLVSGSLHIGVSHTVGRVAVIVSKAPCAVDIEHAERDVSRISDRFMTATERALATGNRVAVAIWSARECYYKLLRDRSLSLLTDISVTDVDFAASRVVVADSRGGGATMCLTEQDGFIIVHTA